MKSLSAEQLLAVADEFAPVVKVRVRSFGALVACAAVPGARVSGVPVHDTPASAATALSEAIIRLEPLTDRNEDFAAIAAAVYRRWAAS